MQRMCNVQYYSGTIVECTEMLTISLVLTSTKFLEKFQGCNLWTENKLTWNCAFTLCILCWECSKNM